MILGSRIDSSYNPGYFRAMSRNCALACLVVGVVAFSAIGCGTPRLFPRLRSEPADPPPRELPDSVRKNSDPPKTVSDSPSGEGNVRQVQGTEIPTDTAPVYRSSNDTISLEPADLTRKPKAILALSGGGSYGAFTAGVLNGWTRSDNRPEFDVVTGVSTGALIAPLAFLGPKYDFEMKKFYTEIRRRDVFSMHLLGALAFRDSVATAAPLRKIVESGVSEEMVKQIAAEHKKGRRLYVATTNLEARKSVVWDLGAIASKGTISDSHKLICDILIASSAVPGIFPPVPISVEIDGKKKTEMHVDGGVTAPIFVPPSVLEKAGKGENPGTLYVLVAGKFFTETAEVRPRLLKVLGASGAALMRSHTRTDVSNLYHMAKLNGVPFRVIALRQDYQTEESPIEFDQTFMTKLYVEGVKVGVDGPVWHTSPPERSPGESDEIRTGRKLLTKP